MSRVDDGWRLGFLQGSLSCLQEAGMLRLLRNASERHRNRGDLAVSLCLAPQSECKMGTVSE